MANDHAPRGEFSYGAPHQVLVCTSCRPKGDPCGPGLALISRLRTAFLAAGLAETYEVSGTACMASCDRPCTVAWQGRSKATWLFGDIDPDQDIDDLVSFTKLYQGLEDGFCRAAERPGKMARVALARIPAALGTAGPLGRPV